MTAIIVPAGKSWSTDHIHLTLAYINSTDKKIVDKVIAAVKRCIETSWYVRHGVNNNPSHHIVDHDNPTAWGKNSVKVGGNVEFFKKSLHNYLTKNKDADISNSVDPEYRPAHVDVKGDYSKNIYCTFRLNDLYSVSKGRGYQKI